MSRKMTYDEFLKLAKNRHNNKFIYNEETERCFNGSHSIIPIICQKHGVFEIEARRHLKYDCKECSYENRMEKFRSNTEEFIEKARKVHGDDCDYSLVDYKGASEYVDIICKKCGNIFQQTPNQHLSGRGCPICKESHLERELRLFLIENNIEFEKSKHFDWLGRQEIDFYLPQYNIGIECQGKHHIGLGGWSDNFDFKHLYECDKKKNILCNENDLKLFYLIEKNYYQAALQFETYNEHNTFTDKSELLKQII